MRIRNLALASVAVMALAMPARADLVLQFVDSPTQVIDDFNTFGNLAYGAFPAAPPITSINLVAGQTRIIQLVMLDTLVGNVSPPGAVSSIPPGPGTPSGFNWTAPRWLSSQFPIGQASQSFGLTLWETRITGTVVGLPTSPTGGAFVAPPNATIPGPNNGNNRISLVNGLASFVNAGSMPPVFSDFGGLVATGNGVMPSINWADFSNQAAIGGRIALFNFEITTVASDLGGSYPITITDRSAFSDFEVTSTGVGGPAGDRIALDSTIFSAAHPTYTLMVNVTPVPEPSSMALAGMALAGLSYKLRRKMKAKAAATA